MKIVVSEINVEFVVVELLVLVGDIVNEIVVVVFVLGMLNLKLIESYEFDVVGG